MNTLQAAFVAVSEAIVQNKELLTSLDAAIGDADHGINMARGFTAAQAKVEALPADADAALLLKTVAMTLISTVGGAAGPLYGTAFLRASAVPAAATAPERAAQMLAAAVAGIKERGKAVRGEKTILDALEPAAEAFAAAAGGQKPLIDCLAAACQAAAAGVAYTKTIIAAKGRASYLGERSLGHQDPGATSTWLMLEALHNFCCRQTEEK
ncbi:MAG: dihydroxyacetone kinase subunit DhaL [Sporomusaceae bacterium]|nr:dihydroxyacetone kinase subunit DhaL [Sporomusaceae bacterium]